jgi:uncharacterized membrane protein YhhN
MDVRKSTGSNGLLYALAVAGSCIGKMKGWHGLEFACTPLMMIILSSWFFFNSRRVGDRFTLLVQAGLFFSLIGDVALMFVDRDDFNFIVGLGAWLIAALCYAIGFAQNIADVDGMDGLLVSILVAFGIGTGVYFFSWDLMPHLDDGLGIPVISFMIALALMGILAAFRFHRTYPGSFWTVLIGALLLIAAGCMLTTDRFQYPMKWAPVWITCTYAAAQFLIAGGALAHVLDPDNLRRREALTT